MGLMLIVSLLITLNSGQLHASFPLPIAFTPPADVVTAKHYTELEFPPLPEVQLPDYERYQLDNGMVVYLMEERELPLVSGTAIIRTGSRLEVEEKTGLGSITGTLLRAGGTKQHTADELNQILEQKAAVVETSVGKNSGSASFESLSEDTETVVNLFAEVLRYPAFADEKLALIQQQTAGGIARRNDEPGDIASREFNKLIYGDTSPYARTVEYDTLAEISRSDVVNFYEQYFHPENVILGIVGDFEPTQMKTLIEKAFGDWESRTSAQPIQVPSASQQQAGNIFFVEQPQLTQSSILLGHLGGQLDSPDYPALSVLNGVMNGFGGRLFNEIRSRQGLAYSVYSYWSPRYDYPGIFIAGGNTRSDATVPFIQSVIEQLKKLRDEPITSQELIYAQESILNSFVFNFQTPEQTLARLMRYEYYGYPDDFIFRYQRAIKNVTVADVQRVAREYLQTEKIVTLVVGNSEEIQPPLSSLGTTVETVDIAIPTPKSS